MAMILTTSVACGSLSGLLYAQALVFRTPPPFSSFGPSRDYGMDLCLEVHLRAIYPYFTTFSVTTFSFY